MKHLNTYITEYIIKKKLDKPIDSENNYKYSPINKEQLINNINECIDLGEYNLNVIDVSSIKDMSKLFRSVNLDKIKRGSKLDISKWDVSNVEFMNYMFSEIKNYIKPVINYKNIENWDVSNVINMSGMFDCCKDFNGDLSNWDVSSLRETENMFNRCDRFKGKGLENWNMSNVWNPSQMFIFCTDLCCDLSKWDLSKIQTGYMMFAQCENFDCDVSNWNIGKNNKLSNIHSMFQGCEKFKGKGLDKWPIDEKVDTYNALRGCYRIENTPSWYKQ